MEFDGRDALRFLGVRGEPDAALRARLADAAARVRAASAPAWTAKLLPLRADGDALDFGGGALSFRSHNLAHNLRGCDRAFLFAATLGAGVDRLVRGREAVGEMADAALLQAAAGELADSLCEDVVAELARDPAVAGCALRHRFSPGYGDLPLSIQPAFLAALDATRRLGITLTSSFLMVPTKSVTAFVGVASPSPAPAATTAARPTGRWIKSIAIAVAMAAGVARAGGVPHATGLLEPPKGTAPAQRVDDPRAPGRLRATARTVLPAKWDARDWDWVSPAKDQQATGTCWAFSALATIETQLLRTGRGLHDLSERNLVNLHGWTGMQGEVGGFFKMTEAYLLRWAGPVAESNDVFGVVEKTSDWTHDSPQLPPVVHVQNIVWTELLDGTPEKAAALKAAVMEYGAVATTMFYNEGFERQAKDEGTIAFHCPYASLRANHGVAVIGWDDAFPTNAFAKPPPGPGAWIVKSSWGPDWGDGGCFRVSYHDAVFAAQDSGAVYLPAGPGEDFDAVRGHDREGPTFDASNPNSAVYGPHDLQAAVFTAAWNERLDAVGVWTRIFPHPCEILVYTNVARGAATPVAGSAPACRQSLVLEHAGFTTIPLETPVPLVPGTAFAVVYRQTGTNLSNYVNSDAAGQCHPDHRAGDSYFGYYSAEGGIEGSTWFDGKTILEQDPEHVDPADVSWAATIKAYTRCVVPAPAADAPGETDEGTAYLADLAATNAVLFAETAGTLGASAGLAGANGRSLWASWLAGLDPADPADCDFTATIDLSTGTPRLGWTPDLGAARRYTSYGRDSLAPADGWRVVDPGDPSADGARFFRVSVGQ